MPCQDGDGPRRRWGRGATKLAVLFDHVGIRVSDKTASERFYEAVLTPIGIAKVMTAAKIAGFGNYEFFVGLGEHEDAVTRRLHVAFAVPSRKLVDQFWRIGTGAGYESDGEPGERPQYRDDYYGAFLLDPDGNSVEAAHHGGMRTGGAIDHMWLRVTDVAASTAFYETIAPYARLFVRRVNDERTQLIGESGSFSVVSGEATRNVHIAFPTGEDATVDDFHRAAIAAGHRDNGPPGERRYHPGYYAAFVLDPDGNNIELVNHNRS